MRKITALILPLLLLVACGSSTEGLPEFGEVTPGPGERAVTPRDPLQFPQTRALPEPTPGGTNLADPG